MIPAKPIPLDWVKEYLEYENGRLFWIKKPSAKVYVGDPAGRINDKYIRTWIQGRPYLVHRIIWAMHYGDTTQAIDHINGDTFDNRIENLRTVTHSENTRNHGKIVGVRKEGSWWVVRRQIEPGGKQVLLGKFVSKELAEQFSLAQNEIYFSGVYRR